MTRLVVMSSQTPLVSYKVFVLLSFKFFIPSIKKTGDTPPPHAELQFLLQFLLSASFFCLSVLESLSI